jgi:hypothetical protein|tara:strand:- start:381 stop:524 length:144 start_codon:yes stop_codon:yes gene_type:complete
MAKISKSFIAHERMPKKTSQGTSKRVKKSSMNKSRKRSFKVYNSQGR